MLKFFVPCILLQMYARDIFMTWNVYKTGLEALSVQEILGGMYVDTVF